MASRKSLKEAQELKEKWEAEYPNAKFKIIDDSMTRTIGGKVIESPQFNILEARQCGCGGEILTAAVGEASLDECKECKAKRLARQKQELEASIGRQARRMADWDAMDEWEEG